MSRSKREIAVEGPTVGHLVYYCHDAAGAIIYVGQTSRPIRRRLYEHASAGLRPGVCRVETVEFPTQAEARLFERAEIGRLRPPRNSDGNPNYYEAVRELRAAEDKVHSFRNFTPYLVTGVA